jgi:cell division protein FtsI (penicillin-binding protein 3)
VRAARVTRAGQRSRRRRQPRRNSQRRLVAMLLLTCILFGGLFVKLAQLQTVSADRYTNYAKGQRTHTETLPAVRGAIYDRQGLPLATTITRHAVWSDSALVTNGPGEAKTLADILGGDAATYQEQLLYGGRFSYLKRQVDDDTARKVQDAKLGGVYLLDEPTRFTPSGGLAQSVVGATDTDNVGTAGIERQFDGVLSGEPGRLVQEESQEGHTIPSGTHRVIPAKQGTSLVLTIDRNLQFTVEQAISQQVAAVAGKRGVALVMDPHSGEILALASVEATGDATARHVVPSAQNLAVTAQFEPGSVLKPVTLAAGMETRGMTPSTMRTVPTSVDIHDTTFVDEHRSATEQMSLSDILTYSDNVGTIGVAQDVGEDGLDDYLRRFRFGTPTGIAFPDEAFGSLPDRADWSGTSLPTLAIGQGVAVTPLQLAAAYSAIANGGEWVTPTLVKATADDQGRQRPLAPGSRTRIIQESTAAQLRDMLASVVQNGTGQAAAVAGYQVAGKTGTAWKAQDGSYGSDGSRAYVASFAGMVPAQDPQLVVVVMIDEPGGAYYSGGQAAAPAFAAIAQPALAALDIAPSGWREQEQAKAGQPQPTDKVRAEPAVAPTTTAPLVPAMPAPPVPATPGTPIPPVPATPGTPTPAGAPPAAVPGAAVPPTSAVPAAAAAVPAAPPPAGPSPPAAGNG